MTRVKEIQEKEQAPKINADAAKRFVRNALWDAAHKAATQQPTTAVKSILLIISVDAMLSSGQKLILNYMMRSKLTESQH